MPGQLLGDDALKGTVMTRLLKFSTSNLISSGACARSICPVRVSISSTCSPLLNLMPAWAKAVVDPNRRLVVDQVAVDHGLAIGICEDRIAEDIARCAAPAWR